MTVPGARRLRRLPSAAGAAILLAALGLAAVACAGAGGTEPNASPVATTSVDLPKSYRFEPASIAVEPGATVTWTNSDNFTHSVRIEDSEPLVMKPGESVQHTFKAPGTFRYDCSFHPQDMHGTVVVSGGL